MSTRFTDIEDGKWFAKCMARVCQEEVGESYVEFLEFDHHFVDFLRYVNTHAFYNRLIG